MILMMGDSTEQTEELNLTDDEFEKMANFDSAITDDEVYEMDGAANDKSRAVQRRLVLAACARSAETISQLSINEPEAFLEMLESIEAFKEHAKGLLGIAEAASIRMLIADCRSEKKV